MNRLIFTRRNDDIISYTFDNDTPVEINLYNEESNILGNIYVGVVDNIVKNIDAVFVRYDKVNPGYLSAADCRSPIFLNRKNTDKFCTGDLVLVQVQKEAMKLKKVSLTCNFEITGQYCVLMHGKKGVNVSSKIKDKEKREHLLELIKPFCEDEFAIIARTNAASAIDEDIINDVKECIRRYKSVIDTAMHAKSGTCVYESEPACMAAVKNINTAGLKEIVVDDKNLYDSICSYATANLKDIADKIRFYDDEYPLCKLYNLEKILQDALRKHVWLKSGGFLVIEPTEALTVIDVNTGKAIKGKKQPMETFHKINLEACDQIARQIRLRNLSGIIIVDFIDVDDDEMKDQMMSYLSRLLSKDPIKTTVIDITKLNLVEITRKKIKAPLHEVVGKKCE